MDSRNIGRRLIFSQNARENRWSFTDPRATATLSIATPGFEHITLDETALLLPETEFFRDLVLNASTVLPETRRRYGEAINEFTESILPRLVTLPELDKTLLAYTEALYAEDPRPGRRQQIVNTISGLTNRAPGLSPLFPGTRAALKGWAPISHRLLLAMTGRQIQAGNRALAVLFCVAWAGLMRASEVIGIRRWQIALPGDYRLERTPKGTCGILFMPQERLFPVSYSYLLKQVRGTVEDLGVGGDLHFTTHSFRHGGAVDAFMRGEDAETISVAGRWASSRTLKHYLKNGRSQLMRVTFSASGELRMDVATFIDRRSNCFSLPTNPFAERL